SGRTDAPGGAPAFLAMTPRCDCHRTPAWRCCAGAPEYKSDQNQREMKMRGKIRKWVEERGFGFVSNDDGRHAFFHFTAIQSRAPEHIHVGDILEYDLSADGAGRLCALRGRPARLKGENHSRCTAFASWSALISK